MSDFVDRLMPLLWTQTWQAAAVVAAITIVTRVKPVRRRPHLAYALWLLVLAKCLTPPLWASPTSVFSWALASAAAPTVEPTAMPTPETSPPEVATSPDKAAQFVPHRLERQLVDSGARLIETSSAGGLPAAESVLPPSTDGADSVSTLPTGLVLAWLIGGTLYFTLSLCRYLRTRRRLIRSGHADTAQLDEMISEISRSLRLRRWPRAILTPQPFGPAVLGLLRPVLVLPESATALLSPERLRLVLAHELIHLRRGDHCMGLVQFLVQTLWWFNPLVWWASRETCRIREQCCDEEVLAHLRCEPAGYAQTLLDVVRLGARSRPLVLTAGVGALHVTGQRLQHIMSDPSRFRRSTPRAYWLFAGLIAWFLLPGAGLAIDQDERAQSNLAQRAAENKPGEATVGKSQTDGVGYTGRVIDKETGKPIEGALVKFGQRVAGDNSATAQTTEHRTDERGEFTISLPVKRESDYGLYHFYAEVEHSQYLRREIRQGEGRAGQPFFKQIDMYRGVELRGVVETPDGEPCKNTRIVVYSVPDPDAQPWDQVQLTTATTTNDEGKFRISASQAGVAAFWVVPDDSAPLVIDLGAKRGDLGTLRLDKGLRLNGRVVDYDGRAVSGVRVLALLTDRIISQIAPPLGGSEMHRIATTDAEGRFRLAPLRSGNYRLTVDTSGVRKERTSALEPVFPSSTIRLREDNQSIEIEPAELVTIDVRCTDTSDRPVVGVRISLSGGDGFSQYQTSAETGEDGRTILAWPKGYRATLAVFGNNEYLYRATRDALPPGDYELVDFGRVEKDLRNIEVVQYKPAKVVVKLANQRGEAIANARPGIRYSASPANMSRWVARGWSTDVSFVKLPDGRWQSQRLFPNEGFTISANAPLQSESQKLKLAEGEVKEIELTLTDVDATKVEHQAPRNDAANRLNGKGTGGNETAQAAASSEVTKSASAQPDQTKEKAQPAAGSATANQDSERKEQFYDHPLTVIGKALDPAGKPIAGATIYLVSTNMSKNKLLGETKTDAEGRYEFRDKPLPIRLPSNKDFFEQGSFQVFGKVPGRAFAWQGMKHLVLDKRGQSDTTTYLAGQRIELDLAFSNASYISGRVIDERRNGVAGATIRLANCDYLNHTGRESHKNYREFWAMSQAAEVMPGELRVTTDDMGRFRFSSVPPEVICWLLVEHPKYAGMSLYSSTADDPPNVHDEGHPVQKRLLLITLREIRIIPVRVVSAASGLPLAGIKVSGYQKRATGTSDYGTSDKEGNLALRLPPGDYKLLGDPPRGENNEGIVRTYQELIVADSQDEQPVTLKMDQGCVLLFRAVDANTGKGIPGVNFWYEGDPPPGSRRGVQSSPSYVDHPKTNDHGELRAVVLSGKRLYGVGFGPPPDGYRAVDSDSRGRELDLPAGETVIAEFRLRRGANPANDVETKNAAEKQSQATPATEADKAAGATPTPKLGKSDDVKGADGPVKKPIDEQQAEFAKVERLIDAIDVLKRRLEKQGMSEYAALLTEESVKRAIRTSVNGIRVDHTRAIASVKGEKQRQALEHEAQRFLKVIKPLYDEILQSGTWPQGAFFQHGPKSPNGFRLNLQVDTRGIDNFELAPGIKPTGYALQIIEIRYGFGGPSDAVLKFNYK